jgi:hypothetical protein
LAATFAMLFVVVSFGVIHAAPASAYALSGCRATSSTITIYNNALISKYITATNAAVARWNGTSARTNLVLKSSSSGVNVVVTGWNAADTYYAVTSGNCAGGVYISQITVTWNDTMDYNLTSTALRMIGTHEFGHVQGLGHLNRTSCSQSPTVMVQGDIKWTCSWGNEPWTDDVNGVNSLY